LSPDVLREILELHKKWLNSEGKEGECANLQNADLQGINLDEVDLRRAILNGADLQGASLITTDLRSAQLMDANLRDSLLLGAFLCEAHLNGAELQEAILDEAQLQNANLSKACLQDAFLVHANLQKADLSETVLRNANLKDADLTDVNGLMGGQLAGSNVSGAKLPSDIHKFEVMMVTGEASRNAGKIFLGTLLGCIYSWITIATTTDARLLTNSASSPLPIIGTEIPIIGFYIVAPLILISVYIYFHIYLQHLWEGLAQLPAIFPDGRALDERAYPSLLTSLVRSQFKLLKKDCPRFSRLQVGLLRLLVWWTVPITFLFFWARYFPRHDWTGTSLQIVMLIAAIEFAFISHHAAVTTLRGEKNGRIHWKRVFKSAVRLFLICFCSFIISLGAIEGVNTKFLGQIFPENATGIRLWIPRILNIVNLGQGNFPFANFYDTDVSTKPNNWAGQKEQINLVKGARLINSNLCYLLAFKSFLVNADLRGADLRWALLSNADLRAANFGDGSGFYSSADLRYSNLSFSNLQGAKLVQVNLSYSNISMADLSEANLYLAEVDEANLFGANFSNANLTGTSLDGANLQEVDFRNSKGLSKRQLQSACNWPLAYYSKEYIELLELPIDHNDRLQDRNLQKANFKKINFRRAIFVKFNLQGANLQRAKLAGANLQGANFRMADLSGADLRFSNIIKADLAGVNLRGANLMKAMLWDVNLMEADLRNVLNLSIEQITKVKTLYKAKLDLELEKQIDEKYHHLLEKPRPEIESKKD